MNKISTDSFNFSVLEKNIAHDEDSFSSIKHIIEDEMERAHKQRLLNISNYRKNLHKKQGSSSNPINHQKLKSMLNKCNPIIKLTTFGQQVLSTEKGPSTNKVVKYCQEKLFGKFEASKHNKKNWGVVDKEKPALLATSFGKDVLLNKYNSVLDYKVDVEKLYKNLYSLVDKTPESDRVQHTDSLHVDTDSRISSTHQTIGKTAVPFYKQYYDDYHGNMEEFLKQESIGNSSHRQFINDLTKLIHLSYTCLSHIDDIESHKKNKQATHDEDLVILNLDIRNKLTNIYDKVIETESYAYSFLFLYVLLSNITICKQSLMLYCINNQRPISVLEMIDTLYPIKKTNILILLLKFQMYLA